MDRLMRHCMWQHASAILPVAHTFGLKHVRVLFTSVYVLRAGIDAQDVPSNRLIVCNAFSVQCLPLCVLKTSLALIHCHRYAVAPTNIYFFHPWSDSQEKTLESRPVLFSQMIQFMQRNSSVLKS